MVFHWILSDRKSPQVSRALLSIPAILNNAVVWMVSTRPLTSKSSSTFNNPLVIVPKAPITIGIIVTFMFHSFFQFPFKVEVLILYSLSFSFILWSVGTVKSTICKFSVLLIIIRSCQLTEIKWSVCMSMSHRSLCVSFARIDTRLCMYHLFIWSNLNFWHIFKWITLPTLSCLVLYSFWANLLHSIIMWFRVSSQSSHNLHLQFVASYLFSLWLDWFLRCCFVLLLGEIRFLFSSSLFLAPSRFSHVRCLLVV